MKIDFSSPACAKTQQIELQSTRYFFGPVKPTGPILKYLYRITGYLL